MATVVMVRFAFGKTLRWQRPDFGFTWYKINVSCLSPHAVKLTRGAHTNFYLEVQKYDCLYDIDIVGTTKINTRSLIVRQNLARNSQCSHKKPDQSTRISYL